MSWEKAQIKINAPHIGTGVKVALRKRGSGTAKMSITFTGVAMKQLGWSQGDKLETMIGTGEHHGLIRMRKNNSVGEAIVDERDAVRGGKYQSVKLGEQLAFVDRPEPSQWVQWEVEDGWLEIVLPKWADETGVKQQRPTAPPRPQPTQQQPTRSVTSSLMGDPPPGRREMLAATSKIKP